MSVREYIGARYVPIFASEAWSSDNYYEPLTIVLYQGNSYTSKQYVPAGVAITNTDYWAQTGNYNAQIEAYRAEVLAYADDIAANTEAIGTINETTIPAIQDDIDDAESDIADLTSNLATVEAAVTAVSTALGAEETARINADTGLSNRITALETAAEPTPLMLVFGDSWCNFNNHPDWISSVCDKLGIDMMNFAQSGSGWVTNGGTTAAIPMNAAQQVEYAYTNMSAADISRVKYIVVCTGVNDLALFNYSVGSYCDTGTGAAAGVISFKNSVASRFPNALVYGTVNVPFWTWSAGNYSAQMFTIEKNFESFVFPGGAVDIIPLRNFNWFLWIERNSYDEDGLHPVKVEKLSNCLLATMKGGGVDACTYSNGFNMVGSQGYVSCNVVFAFENGLLTIYPTRMEGTDYDDYVDIPTGSTWGEFGDIMHINARRVYLGAYKSDAGNAGWYSVVSGINGYFQMRKLSGSSSYPAYPAGTIVIDYNFAYDNKNNA